MTDRPADSVGPDAAFLAERRQWVDREAKGQQEWGASKAQTLWDNLYAPYDPVIDGRVVLDIGCSWGYLLKFLAERFAPARLVGTDVQPWWDLEQHGWDFRSLGDLLEFHVGDLPDIDALRDETVDLVLCTSVLQYLTPEGVEANLRRAYQVLRPGGRFLLRTRTFTSYIGADLHRDIAMPYVHLLYGEDELRRHLEEVKDIRWKPKFNTLTASTYVALFLRSGFEILDARRRYNRAAPSVLDRVRVAFPWMSDDEITCAELEADLVRPIDADDLAALREPVTT